MSVREYLVGVTGAAMLCGIAGVLLPGKGTVSTVIKVLTGVLMILSVARPLVGTSFNSIPKWTQELSYDAQLIVSDAENKANQELRQRIKENCEAYILAKAGACGAAVEVSISLSETMPPVPVGVTVSGAVSPYAKQTLSSMIAEQLGIGKEEQQWIG